MSSRRFRRLTGVWHTAEHASSQAPPRGALADARTHGPATRGQHLIVSRLDEIGPDPRFRLTPLGGGRYGLALYERNHWQPLPYEGGLPELVAVMNTDLAAWAAEWPSP